jgi:hypothetical protein
MKKLETKLLIVMFFALISCVGAQDEAALVKFNKAYIDFFYLKKSQRESAQIMKKSLEMVGTLSENARLEFYFQVLLLNYRLDGAMLGMVRTAIIKNRDIRRLKEHINSMEDGIFHPVDEERFNQINMFIKSIQVDE